MSIDSFAYSFDDVAEFLSLLDKNNNLFVDRVQYLALRNANDVATEAPKPSAEKPSVLELKPLPSHLRYAFLGDNETFPVIVSNVLSDVEVDKLLRVLRKYKSAIGWQISDIKGISPSICMHRILLEQDVKPKRQPQRRLNPAMQEVVRKEVLKLLDNGMIYAISDSEWVCPTQCVSKKGDMTGKR